MDISRIHRIINGRTSLQEKQFIKEASFNTRIPLNQEFEKIRNAEYGGERPLFGRNCIHLDNVTIHAGESALKRCDNVKADNCAFEGKYPFWHCSNIQIRHSVFKPGSRAAIWYSHGCTMEDCIVEAPKMFRKMRGVTIRNTTFLNALETLWDCVGVVLKNVKIDNCDYLFSHTDDIDISNYEHHGNYSFQYCRNAQMRNAKVHSKDAFWNVTNFTIIDSVLEGEYLGWYSDGLTLINCHISGTQPLCYARNLTLMNCTMETDCDLCFEESEVKAEISGHVVSVKNPLKGIVKAESIGQILIDKFANPESEVILISKY